MKRILLSKKVWVSIVGLACALVSTLVGRDIPPEVQANLMAFIGSIIVSFNVGQGLADGISRGRTSAGRDQYD